MNNIPTKNELLTMFQSLINYIECRDMFGKEWEFETECFNIVLKDKNFQLVLFANFKSWQEESKQLKELK